ncbi:hypothetical protein Hte_006910 [Hypoxylon texense]
MATLVRLNIPPGFLPYTYTPLSPTAQTRVIVLQPALDYSAELHCIIHEYDFHDTKIDGYDAVSYTWGEPDFSEELIVDPSFRVRITPNLRDALRRFRLPNKARRLWVDAICIDQGDEDEKSQQIPLMSQIYRSASSVCVWLGDDSKGARILAAIKASTRTIQLYGRTGRWHSSDMLMLIMELVKLPWFSRRWIVQEVVLNADVLLCCGQEDLSMVQLASRISHIENVPPVFHSYETLLAMISLWRRWVLCEEGQLHGIIQLLEAFDSFQCFEAKDRLYALSGIATDLDMGAKKQMYQGMIAHYQGAVPDIHKYNCFEPSVSKYTGQGSDEELMKQVSTRIPLRVNYSVTTDDTYTSFAISVIQSAETRTKMDLLRSTLARLGRTQNVNMPSWAPDWRQRAARKPYLYNGHTGVGLSYNEHSSSLSIPLAACFPCEMLVTTIFPLCSVSSTRGIVDWLRNMSALCLEKDPALTAEPYISLIVEAIRSTGSDLPCSSVQATISWALSSDWEDSLNAHVDMLHDIFRLLLGRVMFCYSCHGSDAALHIGVGADHMQIDDKLVLVHTLHGDPTVRYGTALVVRSSMQQDNKLIGDSIVRLNSICRDLELSIAAGKHQERFPKTLEIV